MFKVLALPLVVAVGCAAPRLSPTESLLRARAAAEREDRRAFSGLLSQETHERVEEYQALQRDLNATATHGDPVGLWMEQFRTWPPDPGAERVGDGNATVNAVYTGRGEEAVFRFEREDGRWRLNLGRDLEPVIRDLETFRALREKLASGQFDGAELAGMDDDD